MRWPIGGLSSPHTIFVYTNQQFGGESALDTAAHQHAGSYSRFNFELWYTNANWLGTSLFFNATAYPFGRFNEVAFEFSPTVVGVGPKAPVTVLGGVHLPLNFLINRFLPNQGGSFR